MDPEANLKEQLKLAGEIQSTYDSADDNGELSDDQEEVIRVAAQRLADLVLALDQWITMGGFLPAAWRVGKRQ